MSESYSISAARSIFPRLVHEAEHGKIVGLTRRGELVAMLIGQRYFEQLSSSRRGFAETYRNFTVNVDLTNLNIQPDRLFPISRRDIQERKVKL